MMAGGLLVVAVKSTYLLSGNHLGILVIEVGLVAMCFRDGGNLFLFIKFMNYL